MRKIVVFTMILTVIFAMAGCTANREPDKKATESSPVNAVIDTTQAEGLTEKTENETVSLIRFVSSVAFGNSNSSGARSFLKATIYILSLF